MRDKERAILGRVAKQRVEVVADGETVDARPRTEGIGCGHPQTRVARAEPYKLRRIDNGAAAPVGRIGHAAVRQCLIGGRDHEADVGSRAVRVHESGRIADAADRHDAAVTAIRAHIFGFWRSFDKRRGWKGRCLSSLVALDRHLERLGRPLGC